VNRADWKSRASARIEDLADRYELPGIAAARLSILLDLLVTDPLAPTSLRDPLKAIDDHLADSLVALELGETPAASAICDLGSGAGFPGLPLAIVLPGAEIALLEGSARKCAFIERASAACEAGNAHAIHARAESWNGGLGRFDLVTARAVASLDVVAEYAAPLLRVGGALVVWRGRRDAVAEVAAEVAAATLGLEVSTPRAVVPYTGAEHRHLHLMLKVGETPPGFPRRPGMARKRPLGGGGAPSDRSRR
jgi:16S rRNA (guanine527-N7)-methyltransferase